MFRLSFLVFVFVSVWCAPALADSPLLPIQGRLLDSVGDPIDGNRTVNFAIYGASTGGSAVYTESQEIGFTGGNFAAYLGDVVTLDPGLFESAPALWLGITIQGDSEMEPRVRLGSAPTAAFSHMCGDAATLGGLAASDFAPKVHSHVAWVDTEGAEVVEALPWAPPISIHTGDGRGIMVRDDADQIWSLDVYTGEVQPASAAGTLWFTTPSCTGQPYIEANPVPPPRFVIGISATGMNVVIADNATLGVQSVCYYRDGDVCVARGSCIDIPAAPVNLIGNAEPVFPYQFPLHPEFP